MKSRSIALCGLLTALAAAALCLGSIIPIAVLCAPILAMVVLLPVLEEMGAEAAWTAYAAAALLALLLSADREAALVYLFFGWYPILRPKIAALPFRPLRLIVRLFICNAAIFLLYGLIWRILGLPEDLGVPLWNLLLLAMGNIVFLLADQALDRMTLLWRRKLRSRFPLGK